MKHISISDITLREFVGSGEQISFREKVETAKTLARIGADVIETAPIESARTDTLFLHTIAPLMNDCVIACPVGLSEEELNATWSALKCAKHPRLTVCAPTSTVQMEYLCHKKPKVLAEALDRQIRAATALCPDVEFSAQDATRSEPEFLASVIEAAIAAGVKTVTLCDSAGEMLPDEFGAFIRRLYEAVPSLSQVTLSVECSDKLAMGVATVLAAVSAGAGQIKAAIGCKNVPALAAISDIFRTKGDALGFSTSLKDALLGHAVGQ